MEMDEKTLETIKSVAAICAAIVPIVVFVLSKIFLSFDVRSKSKTKNLCMFFDNVLVPITNFLRHSGVDDIEIKSIQELNRIYEKNHRFIPYEMHIRFCEMKYCVMQNGYLTEKEYNRYARYINCFYLRVRKKLCYPDNYGFAFTISTPMSITIIKFIPMTIFFIGYEILFIIYSLVPESNLWIPAFICAALTLIYLFAFHIVETIIFNKKKLFIDKKETLSKNIIYPVYYANKKSANCNRHHHIHRSITTSIRGTVHKKT